MGGNPIGIITGGGGTTLVGATLTAAGQTFVSETANAIAAIEMTDLKLGFISILSSQDNGGMILYPH